MHKIRLTSPFNNVEKPLAQRRPARATTFPPLVFSATSTVFLLIVLFFTPSAFGQTVGTVKGKVRNMRGDNIAGATIIARHEGKDVKSVRSGPSGDFVMDGLDSGTYNIVFDAKGYSSGVKYSVEVKPGQTVDLGSRLILQTDLGTKVIVRGSVFYKDGTIVAGAEVKVERVNADGSTKKIGTVLTNYSGEFAFSQSEGAAKFRMTVKHKDTVSSKEIEVDNAAIYRLAISLSVNRDGK